MRVAFAQCTSSSCATTRLLYRSSTDGGVTWTTAASLAGSSSYSFANGIAATAAGRVYLLYDSAESASDSADTVYLRIR